MLRAKLLPEYIWKLQYHDFDAVWYEAVRVSRDELQVYHPGRGRWVSGDPAHFELRDDLTAKGPGVLP